jgi:hypothetical protein
MIYQNTDEIFTMLEKVRGKMLARVAELSDAEANFRPAPDAWTATEIVEHIGIVERGIIKLLNRLTEKAEAENIAPIEGGQFSEPVSFVKFAELTAGVRIEAPEAMRPTGSETIAASISVLNANREMLSALRPRLEKVNLSEAKFPHPAFGAINGYYWLALLGTHEARHLQQLETAVKLSKETA